LVFVTLNSAATRKVICVYCPEKKADQRANSAWKKLCTATSEEKVCDSRTKSEIHIFSRNTRYGGFTLKSVCSCQPAERRCEIAKYGRTSVFRDGSGVFGMELVTRDGSFDVH
jgi:hypothetical protein